MNIKILHIINKKIKNDKQLTANSKSGSPTNKASLIFSSKKHIKYPVSIINGKLMSANFKNI
jgi:hypothetical protein